MSTNTHKEVYKMEQAKTFETAMRVLKPFPLLDEEEMEEFYVNTMNARGDDPVYKIVYMLRSGVGSYQKFLFIGHSGSGKSTELYRMRKELRSEFDTICFSIEDEIDIQDFDYIDFIFALLRSLLKYSNKQGYGLKEETINRLYEYWTNDTILEIINTNACHTEASSEAKLSFLGSLTAKVSGVLNTGMESKKTIRQVIEPQISQLISQINEVFQQLENVSQKHRLVVIVDDLDKLEIQKAQELFVEHRRTITSLHINTIFTFPIYLFYSPAFMDIQGDFDSYQLLSMIKTHDKQGTEHPEGIRTLTEIVERRVSPELFEDGVIKYAIKNTGGSLRDIFYILLNGILNAKVQDKRCTKVNLKAAEKAFLSLKSTYERFTAKKYIDPLVQLYQDPFKKPIDNNNELMELLQATAVIEYNGERWCDLHPAVKSFLIEKEIIRNAPLSSN